MKALKNVLKIAERVLLGILILVLLVGAVFSVKKYVFKEAMPKLFGYSYLIIISGSMEPNYSVDDLIVTKAEDAYAVGDVVTFTKDNYFVTHRIVDVTEEGYVTKGDANNTKDGETVTKEDIQGKVIASVPKVGRLYVIIMSPTAIAIYIALIIAAIAAPVIINRIKEDKGKKSYEKNKKAV